LFFVSLGIVGYMWDTLRRIDRVLLILAAAVMAVIPIEFSIPGIVPAVIGVLIIVRNVMRHRKRLKQEPSQG
jgi:Ni,Fe-hydrogenase III small subunit